MSKFDCQKPYKLNMCMAAQYKPKKPVAVAVLLHGLSPRANYTDRATAASRRSVANLCG
jgi:hypothetical protein